MNNNLMLSRKVILYLVTLDMSTIMKNNLEMLKKKNIQPIKYNIAALIFYIASTIPLTYPVVFKIQSSIPGGWDAFLWLRTLWYTKYAIFNPNITSLTYDNLLFYPNGVPTMPFLSAFNQIMYLALSSIFEIHIIYSLLWLLTFVLGAFGTFLLVKYLTSNYYAAIISGIIFAYAPYHFAHSLGHLGATTIQWIPFCALYLMKMFKEGGRRNSILAGFFFLLVAMSDFQYLVFTTIFVGLLFIFELSYRVYYNNDTHIYSNIKDILKKYCYFGITVLPGLLPLTINDILIALSDQNFLKPAPSESVKYSTDFLSFFLPSILHPFFGSLVKPIYLTFLGNIAEYTTFIGYTVLLLSIYASIVYRKDIILRFWLISAFTFSILSLGPLLKICGNTTFTVFNTTIPLPFLVLYYIVPFVENCRTTGRFFVIASLAFAVLAGYGITKILEKHEAKKLLFSILFMTLICFEYVSVPFPVSPVTQPEFFLNLSSDHENYGILGLPTGRNYDAQTEIIYYQTIHNKSLVGTHQSRIPQDIRNFERNTPLIRELDILKPVPDILKQEDEEIGNSVLNFYNIRYIVIHEKYMSNSDVIFTMNLLNESLKTKPLYYKQDSIIVYPVPNVNLVPFMTFGKGWYTQELWNNTPGRWINQNASLNLISPNNNEYILSFDVSSFHIQNNLSLMLNNIEVYSGIIPRKESGSIKIEKEIFLKKGENLIEFNVSHPGMVPSDIGAWDDSRKLTLAFQNITLSASNTTLE